MSKVVNLSNINHCVKNERKIVFVHGVFDLFHMGHLAILTEAAKLGSQVVVGLDSDEFAQQLKRKPLFTLNHRLHIVSHLDCVNFALPLNGDNRERSESFFWKVYSFLQPDIVAFGPHCPFADEIKTKCSILDIEAKQIFHDYADVTTSFYLNTIKSGSL